MSKQQTQLLPESPESTRAVQDEAVGAYVLGTLGRPANLFAVQVRRLWEDHFRVNVLVGENASAVTIAHSYFLVMGSDGSCLACTPAVTREYAPKKTVVAPVT